MNGVDNAVVASGGMHMLVATPADPSQPRRKDTFAPVRDVEPGGDDGRQPGLPSFSAERAAFCPRVRFERETAPPGCGGLITTTTRRTT